MVLHMYYVHVCIGVIQLLQKASPKDTVGVTTSSVESRPSTKREPAKTTTKPPTAASSKMAAGKDKEKKKKLPLCPYGTKCYRY